MPDATLRPRDEGEARRLEECSREPIRTPGRIQSHGRLLAVDPATELITVVSADAEPWLGRRISEVGDATLTDAVREGGHGDPFSVEMDGERFEVTAKALDGRIVIDFERPIPLVHYDRTSVVGALQRVTQLNDIATIRDQTAREIRGMTGYDRVIVYDFHDDGHGEIVGEAHADDMDPYRGLHFPASDIPSQARALYVSKLSRVIADTEDYGVDLLTLEGAPQDIDLSHSELRAVSPHHLAYMRNMDQAATVSISLVRDGQLVGMITCAHRTPRRLPVLMRRSLEVLGMQLVSKVNALEINEALRRQLDVNERRRRLLTPLTAAGDIHATLLDGNDTVLELVPADAVIVRIGDTTRSRGGLGSRTPARVVAAVSGRLLVSDQLATDHPEIAEVLPGYAGILTVPLSNGRGELIFLRREVSRVVRWLGDLGDDNRDDHLSPRNSFAEWKQSMAGLSLSWDGLVAEAADLGRDLDEVMARREEMKLAEQAMLDPLTGLHNRRYLVEQLDAPVSGVVLFLDLDGFKAVNDSLGHEAGDKVLVAAAERLLRHSRADDIVARLGGDEFVVLCRGLAEAEAEHVAERMIVALAEPVDISSDKTVRVTASCGIVPIEAGMVGREMLDSADAAMYRAKRAGRDRTSR